MRPTPSALSWWILAFVALLLAAPSATATPLGRAAIVTVAQQTGGSFGGSRWGSGSTPTSTTSSSSSGSGSYSSGRSSWSGGSSHSSGHDQGGFDLLVLFFYLVVWCFSVSPILGLGVLGVGLGFLLFVWFQRS